MTFRIVDGVRLFAGVRATTAVPVVVFARPASGAEIVLLRVLGARQVLQAVVASRTGWRTLSAGVDLLHGASMLALAAAAPRRLGAVALRQAATAAALLLLELRAQRRER